MMSIEQSAKQMEGTAIREQAETMARVVSLENDLGGKELPGEELSKLFPGKEYFLLDEEEAVEIYKVNEQGKPISRDIYKEGKDYICGIAKIEGAETYLVVQKTYEEAYGEVNRMKTVAIAFTVLAIIGLWCIGKRISFIIQKPIKDLALTVKQIAAGDISQGVQVNSNDELAEIAVAFNKMLDHLKLTMKQVLDKSGEAASMHEIMQYVEQTYDQHAGGVLSIDNIGEITTFNETAELLTGISAKELIGRHISNPIPPEIKGLIDTLRRTLSQGSVNFKKIADIQHINGERIPIVYTANIQFGMKDEVIGAICVFRRIEDIRKFEESALRRKNLGALGEMAASLAHEVKNPLTSIRGYAQYLKLDFSDDSDCPEELNIILHEVDRLTNMLDNFLKFARPEVPKLELVDIRAVSNYVVKLVEKELPKN
ncbi:MAG: histidine kinase dimerization/phospho-acceptor domain-containing protein, partial [Anaerovoracaceae bacterium]